MSDTSGAFPPPPPSSVPPPTYGAPPPPPAQATIRLPKGYQLPPEYQGPTAPDYLQPYQQQQPWQQQQQPWQQQPVPSGLTALAMGGGGGLTYHFGGAAAVSILMGVVSIVVPFVTNFYFPILPIFGLINGIRAIQRGRLFGGMVGLVVSALGGLVSLFASGLLGSG
jgi:hypothetical protein